MWRRVAHRAPTSPAFGSGWGLKSRGRPPETCRFWRRRVRRPGAAASRCLRCEKTASGGKAGGKRERWKVCVRVCVSACVCVRVCVLVRVRVCARVRAMQGDFHTSRFSSRRKTDAVFMEYMLARRSLLRWLYSCSSICALWFLCGAGVCERGRVCVWAGACGRGRVCVCACVRVCVL